MEVASVKVISIDELNSNWTFELVMAKSWESNNDRKNPISKTNRTAWITLAILSFTQIITMHSETMLLPAIPDIIVDFNLSFNDSSWVLSSYLIAGAVADDNAQIADCR